MKCKRILIALIVLILCLLFAVVSSAASIGDVDGDGFVRASDARLALRASVRLELLTVEERNAADVDFSGSVDASDARSILRCSVALEKLHTEHVYDKEVVSKETLKTEASCRAAAIYYKSCVCGNIASAKKDTFSYGSPLAHDYKIISSKEATCKTAASTEYRCSCGASYVETKGDCLGHDINGVDASEIKDAENPCLYTLYYTCRRDGCNEAVKAESIYRHNYMHRILTPVNCRQDGLKEQICLRCGEADEISVTADTNAHVWVKGEEIDGSRTDACSVCAATKQVIVCNSGVADDITADALKTNEIELKDVCIRFDDGAADFIGEKTVTVSTEKVEGDDRADLGLSDRELEQIGDNPIYDFSVSDGTQKISQFGGNRITVTLPYALSAEEDVDSIAVWFIGDDGAVESVPAVYNNGFVTFETNHFSYYTVTRLTPAQRCELYGHSNITHSQALTCLLDSYTLTVCVRCHHTEKTDVVAATGHDYVETITESTCTQDGSVTYTCTKCQHSYSIKQKASGHGWSVKEQIASTCLKNGKTVYKCEKCGEEYTETLAKLEHVFENTTVTKEPTCVENGERQSICICNTVERFTIPATAKHTYENGICTGCGRTDGACDHSVLERGSIDLSEFGTCGGFIYYDACPCGDVIEYDLENSVLQCSDYIEVESESGSDTEYHASYSCSRCKMHAEMHAVITYDRENCSATIINDYSFKMNGEAFLEFRVIEYNVSVHDEEYGKVLNLKKYGACGGTITVNICKTCGYFDSFYDEDFSSCDMKETERNYDDENGNTVSVITLRCEECGLVYETRSYLDVESECVIYRVYSSMISCQNMVIANKEYRNVEKYHTMGETNYSLLGENCQDGVQENRQCTVCDYEYNEIYYYHISTKSEIVELKGHGICDKPAIRVSRCTLCDQVTDIEEDYMNCHMVESGDVFLYDRENNAYRYTDTACCERCGLTIVSERICYIDGCLSAYETVYSYIMEDEEIYTLTINEGEGFANHKYIIEPELNGQTCMDGGLYSVTCKECNLWFGGELSFSVYNDHQEYSDFILAADQFDCCEDHYISVRTCVCGECIDFGPVYGLDGVEETENGIEYFCEDCGLSVSYYYTVRSENCSQTIEKSLDISMNGKSVYHKENTTESLHHNFRIQNTKQPDGTFVADNICADCGEQQWIDVISAKLQETDGEYIYDYVFEPTESGLYSIAKITDAKVDVNLFLQKADGTLTDITYADNCCSVHFDEFYLAAKLTAGEKYVCRIYCTSAPDNLDIEFILSQGVSSQAHCNHEGLGDFVALLPGANSCEDGVANGEMCTKCGLIFDDISVCNDHVLSKTETINVEEFGACYGEIYLTACACGYDAGLNVHDSCAYSCTSENEFYDDEDRLVTTRVYSCDSCGLRCDYSWYCEREEDSCDVTQHCTVVVSMGAELIYKNTFTKQYKEHDYTIDGTLVNGVGSSCMDGTVHTYTCKRCDYSYDEEYRSHVQYEKARIDLTECGSVCGGYAIVTGCACGVYNDLNLDHCLCEIGYGSPTTTWPDAAKPQYTTNGFNGCGAYSNIYKCAVTDPVACGFNYKVASYWKQTDGECFAYPYTTYLLGYDETTDTWKYEITFTTGKKIAYHDYVVTEIENGTLSTCKDCGSTLSVKSLYDDQERLLQFERIATNTLENGEHRYRIEIRDYAYDSNDQQYCTRDYLKYIDADNQEFWTEITLSRTDYTGPFGDSGAASVELHTSSTGYYHKREWANVSYMGWDYSIYNYSTYSERHWEKYDYSYSFDGPCIRTVTYTSNRGEAYSETYTENCCYETYDMIKAPTCSQSGLYGGQCRVCKEVTDVLWTEMPYDHTWMYDESGYFYCSECGLENKNGVSGAIIMEDLSADYGEGEYFVVGYYNRNEVEFTHYVSIVLADETEIILDNSSVTQADDLVAFMINKAAVNAAAEKLGYEADEYDVRFTFVPYGSDGSFDYALTFTE